MTGVERIAQERIRQINEEGWSSEHDDGHPGGAMARAAACYAAPVSVYSLTQGAAGFHFTDLWPWESRGESTTRTRLVSRAAIDTRIRELEKAGALCAAEIDRLIRRRVRHYPSPGGPLPTESG